ncbi:MAG: NosD domain-containing protein [archaeon]|nr:NosD domain-containing protein [archaeon]
MDLSTAMDLLGPRELRAIKDCVMQYPLKKAGRLFEIGSFEFGEGKSKVSISSSESMSIVLPSFWGSPEFYVEPSSGAKSSPVKFSGLLPNTKYYFYIDDYHSRKDVVTDGAGEFSYAQDLTGFHNVWLQTRPSTIFIDASLPGGGDCEGRGVGRWDSGTRTCTLVVDLNETIQFDSNSTSLDCAGHVLGSDDNGSGIYAENKFGLNVENCSIINFENGVYFLRSKDSSMTNNTIYSSRGNALRATYSSGIMASGNQVNVAYVGFYSISASDFVVNDNNFSEVALGVLISESNNVRVTNNILDFFGLIGIGGNHVFNCFTVGNILDGFAFSLTHGSVSDCTITGNMIKNSSEGLELQRSNRNTISGNSFVGNDYGIIYYGDARWDSNSDVIVDNNFSRNDFGVYFEDSSLNTVSGNVFVDGNHGVILKTNSNRVFGNEFVRNVVYGLELFNPVASNLVYDNDFYVKGIRNASSRENIFCVECVGNRYFDGATGPMCEFECHCQNGIYEPNLGEEGIDCGGNCQACEEKYSSQYGNCVPLVLNGPDRNHIDVGFIGSGFPDVNTFSWVANDMIDYDGANFGLMAYKPFSENKTKFNFWRSKMNANYNVNNYESSTEDLFEACPFLNQSILLSVTPRFQPHAVFATGSLESVFPLGIGGRRAYVPVGCEYLGTCPFPLEINIDNYGDPNCQGFGDANPSCSPFGSFKTDIVRTFTHEFGHSFGGLLDEYKDDILINPFDPILSPNCDIFPCLKWFDIAPLACIPGCTFNNWYRAYDNTLMKDQYAVYIPQRDWIHDFNKVNERELEKDIDSAIVDDISGKNPNNIFGYVLEMAFSNSQVSVSNVKLVADGSPNNGVVDTGEGFVLKVTGQSGTIYDYNFGFPLIKVFSAPQDIFDDNGNQTSDPDYNVLSLREDSNFSVIVPYFPNAISIEVYDSNNDVVFSENVENLKPVNYILGYRGTQNTSTDYNLVYTLISQPTDKLVGQDINVLLGWSFYFD